MEQEYKYYAFISYNRKDEEWARWIQYEFDKKYSSIYDPSNSYEQEEKDSVAFEHLVSLALEANFFYGLLPIKVSNNDNVLIQDKYSDRGFIINKTTNSVKEVSSSSEILFQKVCLS